MKQLPEHLFHFTSYELGRSMLQAGRLTLETDSFNHNPLLQNQPFDEAIVTVSEQAYQQELKHQYDQLPAHVQAMISFSYFCQQSEHKRENIEAALLQKAQLVDPPRRYPEHWKKLSTLTLFEAAEHFGLWHNRGSRHGGLALQLNTTSNTFLAKPNEPAMLRAVNYTDQRDVDPDTGNPFPGCFDLPPELAAEREWRLVKPLSAQPKGLALGRDTLTGIVFGAQCSDRDIHNLKRTLQNDMRYKSVRYGRMLLHPRRLTLVLRWF